MLPQNSAHISCFYNASPEHFSFSDPTCQIWMMHWGKDQKRAHCAICHSMWLPTRLCTEKSPVAAYLWAAAFSRLWVLSESGITQELKHQEMEIPEVVTLFHLFYLFQLHVLTMKFWNFIFKSHFHWSFIPSEILTSECALRSLLKCFFQLKLKMKKRIPH